MTLKEYQEKALKNLNTAIMHSKKERMKYCCMGLLEETGEVVSELRKPLYKGNFHEKNLDKEAITSELGDMVWYIALICKNTKIDIMSLNSNVTDIQEGSENRKKLINNSIILGETSGEIVKRYLQLSKGEREKKELEKNLTNRSVLKLFNVLNSKIENILRKNLESMLRIQYRNIIKLANELNIQIEYILERNLEKVDSRYDGFEREDN